MNRLELYDRVLRARDALERVRADLRAAPGDFDSAWVTQASLARVLVAQEAHDRAMDAHAELVVDECRELEVTRARGSVLPAPIPQDDELIGTQTPLDATLDDPDQDVPPVAQYSPAAVWDSVASLRAHLDMLRTWRHVPLAGATDGVQYRQLDQFNERSDLMALDADQLHAQLAAHRQYLLRLAALPPHDQPLPSPVDPPLATYPVDEDEVETGRLLRLLHGWDVPPQTLVCVVAYALPDGTRRRMRVDVAPDTTWQALMEAVADPRYSAHTLRFAARLAHVGIWHFGDRVQHTLRVHDALPADPRDALELLAWHWNAHAMPVLVVVGDDRHLLLGDWATLRVSHLLWWLARRAGSDASLRYENDPHGGASNAVLASTKSAGQLQVAAPEQHVFEPYRDTAPGVVPLMELREQLPLHADDSLLWEFDAAQT